MSTSKPTDRHFDHYPYYQGYYWVYASPCCQDPPSCGLLHGPPRWSVEFICEDGIQYSGEFHEFDKFVGHIGQRLHEPDFEPDSKGWDKWRHYTWKIG